jgi:hypothetical protein
VEVGNIRGSLLDEDRVRKPDLIQGNKNLRGGRHGRCAAIRKRDRCLVHAMLQPRSRFSV